jgi:hypothetical protein
VHVFVCVIVSVIASDRVLLHVINMRVVTRACEVCVS